MSLLPTTTFPGALFFEARLLGQPCNVVSQVGLSIDAPECSVAVFSRTSGVLLVAGVGSYCAYRICTRYLGRRFVWMLLESARCDQLPSADRRLLYDCNIGIDEDCEQTEAGLDSDDEWRERVSSSRPASQISRSSRFRRSVARGLLALRQPPRSREGVLSRRTSPGGSIASSRSDRSASLRIVFEGGIHWDDEFAGDGTGIVEASPRRFPRISHSTNVQSLGEHAQSIGDLCSVFDDVMSVVSGVDPCVEEAPCETDTDSDMNRLIDKIKCMTDSKYMYHSALDASEVSSVCSSVLSGRSRRKNTSGLWQLSADEPSTSQNTSMTDSGFSRSQNSRKTNNSRSMFDSAICADIYSEDGSCDFERSCLETVDEQDHFRQCGSSASLEWCDDEFRSVPSRSMPLPEWDSQSHRILWNIHPHLQPSSSRDLMLYTCQKLQPYSPQFKLIQRLYHRDRLKRVATTDKYEGAEQLAMFVASCRYHDVRPLAARSWTTLEESLHRASSEFDFLARSGGCSQMLQDLRTLRAEFNGPQTSAEVSNGIRVLILLEAIEVYRQKLLKPDSFPWFKHENPSTVHQLLQKNDPLDDTCFYLLARAMGVSIELHNADAPFATSLQKIGTSDEAIPWLQLCGQRVPLFYVPDY